MKNRFSSSVCAICKRFDRDMVMTTVFWTINREITIECLPRTGPSVDNCMFLPECRKHSSKVELARDYATVGNGEDEKTGVKSVEIWICVQRVNPTKNLFLPGSVSVNMSIQHRDFTTSGARDQIYARAACIVSSWAFWWFWKLYTIRGEGEEGRNGGGRREFALLSYLLLPFVTGYKV